MVYRRTLQSDWEAKRWSKKVEKNGGKRLLSNLENNPSDLHPELNCSIDLRGNNKSSAGSMDTKEHGKTSDYSSVCVSVCVHF